MEFRSKITQSYVPKENIKKFEILYKVNDYAYLPEISKVKVIDTLPDYDHVVLIDSPEYHGFTDLSGLYKDKDIAKDNYLKILEELRDYVDKKIIEIKDEQ